MPKPAIKVLAASLVIATLLSAIAESDAQNQNNRRRNNQNRQTQPVPKANRTNDLRKIDNEAVKVEDDFIREAFKIAQEYEKAGDLERSIEYLEAMLKIRPELPGAQEKIDDLKNNILSANDYEIELKADGGWSQPIGFVRQGKPFRIQAKGQYKVSLSTSLGPEGIPAGDIQREMLEGIETGKLAGVIVTNNKPGEPFAVGADLDLTPEQSGLLLLKVNVPPGSKCTGELDIQLSGYILSPKLDNIGKK